MADYDSEIVKNPKFKAYGDDFLASLQSFDKVKEWADLIKCIQKVQKVLEKYPQFPLLPHRLVFCKRIAQCLNPALPGGVHAKAIQTLMIVYEKIGPERLSKDLGMYTMGVLALFQDASIKVKPLILSLIETHMLPLNKALIPCMTGFVISLMPGLEEEGSETYPRIQKLFDVVAKRTNPKLFFRSVWKSISMSPAARCPALNFLLSRIPVDKSNPEVIEVFMPERFTLVQSALIQALSDPNLLTQRAALELLITHFTLQSRIFNDWVPIAESALILLTHKEVSLNRRLYQWFLGALAQQGEDSEEGAAPMSAPKVLPVYETYGKITLVSALHNIFKRKAASKAESILPIQILMPLLDKPEIGESIIELVLPDAFDLLARYKEGHEFSYDVTHSVSQLFDILNPEVVFGLLRQSISEQVEKSDTAKLVQVISWIDAFISCLPLTEIEAKARAQFVPKLLCSLINGLIFIRSQGCSELIPGLRLIKKVFGRLSNGDTSNDELVEALRAFGDLYAKIVNDRLMPSLRQGFFVDEAVRYQQLVNILVEATETLVTVYTHYTTPLHSSDPSVLPDWLSALLLPSLNASDCFAVCTTAKAFAVLLSQPNFGLEASQQRHIICNTNFIPEIISKLWTFLSYDQSQFHYTIADILCVLYSTAEDKVTTILGDKLLQEELHKRFEACEKFSLIWRLTTDRPHAFKGNLLLMLDTLSDHQPMVRLAGRSWLADSLHRAERILDPLFEILMSPNTARCNYIYRAEYDTQQVLYILQTLKKVLDCDFQMFLKFAMMKSINHSLTNLNDKQYLPISSDPSMQSVELLPIALEPNNYLELMVLISLRFMMGSCSQYVETISLADMNEGGFVARNRIVQSTAANFLNHLLLKIFDRDVAVRLACQSQELILRALGQAVLVQDLDLQVELLRLLLSVLTLRESYKSKASEFPPLCSSPLFLQTMVGGMMQPAHMNVRFYWMEFFTLGLPYFRSDMPVIVVPILRCLCTILESLDNVLGSVGAKEVLVVLRTLHDLTMMCLEEKSPPPIVAPAESSLLLLDPTRLFTNFVSAINPTPEVPTQQLSELSQAREELFRDLPFILETLLKIRADPEKATSGNPTGKVNEDEVSNRYLIENRIHTILDPIMANFPQEMVAGLCTLWSKSRNDPKLSYMPKAIMGLLNLLDSTKPDVIYRSMANIISSTIRARNKIREKKGPNDTVPSVTIHETTVLDFAKRFTADLTLSKGETDRLLQAWADIQLLVKEGMTSRSPLSFVLLLRMIHVFVSRVSANLGNEEKKTKKELQDTALKLVEINLKISTDSCASNDPELKPNETIDSENFKSLLSKKYAISLKALATVSNVVPGLFGVLFPDRERAISYILPQIFTFLRDHKETNLPWVHLAVRFLANLMKAGFPTKSWKKDALDLFYDNCFFLIDFNTISEWKSLIHEIMVSDRTNFENLMRVASKSFQAHQPAMMFVSKEQENILRARNIKRIAFVLYCSEFDYYVNQLPAILERIVEAIKSSPSSLIVQQIFLLMRVILLRVSPKKLTNFWPVIMHELMRSLTFNPKSPQYDKVMLSAIKFVDMAQLIPCEQLKLFEWIFVRDHFETISSPIPLYESYLDSIANATPIRSEGRLVPPSKARRPLVALRDLSTFEQLASTMQYYSDFSYQACVTGGALDTAMVERIVEADFVEYERVDGFASSPAQMILLSQSSGESSEAKQEQEVFDYGRLEDNNDGGPEINESEITDLPQDYNVMAIPDFDPRESGDLSIPSSSSSSSSLSLSPSFSSSSVAIGSQTSSSSSSSSSNGDHF